MGIRGYTDDCTSTEPSARAAWMLVHFKWDTCLWLSWFGQKMAWIRWKWQKCGYCSADFGHFLPELRQPKARLSHFKRASFQAAQANVSVDVQASVGNTMWIKVMAEQQYVFHYQHRVARRTAAFTNGASILAHGAARKGPTEGLIEIYYRYATHWEEGDNFSGHHYANCHSKSFLVGYDRYSLWFWLFFNLEYKKNHMFLTFYFCTIYLLYMWIHICFLYRICEYISVFCTESVQKRKNGKLLASIFKRTKTFFRILNGNLDIWEFPFSNLHHPRQ